MRTRAVVQPGDAVEAGQAADIHQPGRARDAALHQVQQIGAGGEVSRTGQGAGRHRLGDGGRAGVVEAVHAACLSAGAVIVCWASSTASVMPT